MSGFAARSVCYAAWAWLLTCGGACRRLRRVNPGLEGACASFSVLRQLATTGSDEGELTCPLLRSGPRRLNLVVGQLACLRALWSRKRPIYGFSTATSP